VDVGSVMKREVVSIRADQTLEDAIRLVVEKRVGTLPVVDDQGRLVGILGLREILQLSWPTLLDVLENFDYVHDFGVLEQSTIRAEDRARPVGQFMQPATSVETDCGLLRAEAVMRQHHLRDLPVVDGANRLVGLASWVDVGVAFLQHRSLPPDPS
jgi:CBS domain-containing protein